MDNGAQFVDKVLEVSKHEIQTIGDHKYHVSHKGATLINTPKVQERSLFSLSQVVALAIQLVEQGKSILINSDHEGVEINSKDYNANLQFDVYGSANAGTIFTPFPFGQKLSQEDFIINVMSKFVQNETTVELLKLVSSITKNDSAESHDNGFSQSVTVKTGIALVQKAELKNLWKLTTFKTFPEVQQPTIPYILRVHDGNRFALYECDGGAWKVQTAIEVREYLVNQIRNAIPDDQVKNVVIL